jgi:hypothetical protein
VFAFRSVVGVLLEALDLLLIGFETLPPFGVNWSLVFEYEFVGLITIVSNGIGFVVIIVESEKFSIGG